MVNPFAKKKVKLGLFYIFDFMDNEVLVYIVVGIIYYVIRAARSKKKRTAQSQPTQRPTSPVMTQEDTDRKVRRNSTFEELLKEFQQETPQIEEEAIEEPMSKSQKVEPRPDFQDEGSKRWFADDESKEIYEKSIREATIRVEEKPGADYSSGIRFKEFKIKKKSHSDVYKIKKTLRNHAGVKQAFLMSEIIRPKYL